MSRNPYAPPGASVTDPPPPVAIPRPRHVTLAVRLQWLSFALGLGTGLMRQSWDDFMVWGTAVAFMGLYSALVVWLILKIARGRNWARITYTVLLVLGYVSIVTSWTSYSEAYRSHAELFGLDIIDTVLDVGGVYFMFTRAANAWFAAYTRPATMETGK